MGQICGQIMTKLTAIKNAKYAIFVDICELVQICQWKEKVKRVAREWYNLDSEDDRSFGTSKTQNPGSGKLIWIQNKREGSRLHKDEPESCGKLGTPRLWRWVMKGRSKWERQECLICEASKSIERTKITNIIKIETNM